ncbi:LysM peptidoglycan-binding domain-containing protein [Ancylomarina euxinus]|uniref:LysM peptidoglycan-binding domain-containing protein n=1 Tax=Ancylomarina euxinus TaxID=2283627 RepID=A0A425XZ12_9BACT|nr:lytic transglycosylase domain-containing protein [Ancylomarina euxinus]MCZ4695644.1 transglycosylase SLT domain-containing protein [Ancylomarina euxinus]MUP16052.1 transglycosylase SLT domain-containing protein [Ancylomarina euxinus]RRG20296.1 LysM peptidoglycan-binding domain-containing protein [Ancylomarina euxinus]
MRDTILALKNLLFIVILLSAPFVCQADKKWAEDRSSKNIKHTHTPCQLNENETEVLNNDVLAVSAVPVFTNEDYSWRIKKLNEASPVQLDFNDIVKRYIDVYSVRHRDKTARILGLSEIYFPIFEEYLDKYDLPLELKYIAVIESALNPKARSRSGATGLWQFMYHASRMFDLKISSYVDERMDPVKSTDAACKYLQYLYRIFGDWQLAIAAYNGGPGVVRDAIKASGGKTNFWEIAAFLPDQTRTYVPAFIAVNYVMNYNQEHNIAPENMKFSYLKLSDVTVKEPLSLQTVSKELDISIADLRRLNPIYKLDFIPNSELPAKLTLPVDIALAYVEKESELYAAPKTKVLYHDIERNMSLTSGKKCIIHVVKAGEFFHKIAMKYACTSNNLKKWNKINGDVLHIGQKLKVWVPVSETSSSSQLGLKSTVDEFSMLTY